MMNIDYGSFNPNKAVFYVGKRCLFNLEGRVEGLWKSILNEVRNFHLYEKWEEDVEKFFSIIS